MTWLRHRCWYCGHKSRRVEFIVGDSNYQCVFDDRSACEQRRRWADEDRALAFAAQESAYYHARAADRLRSLSPEGER